MATFSCGGASNSGNPSIIKKLRILNLGVSGTWRTHELCKSNVNTTVYTNGCSKMSVENPIKITGIKYSGEEVVLEDYGSGKKNIVYDIKDYEKIIFSGSVSGNRDPGLVYHVSTRKITFYD